jgi:hypothetical protein
MLADRGYPILDEKYNYHVLSENVNPQKTEQLHENLGLEMGKKNSNTRATPCPRFVNVQSRPNIMVPS